MQIEPAKSPTLRFIGVTTAKSLIMKVFPLWAKELGLSNATIKGIDIEIHADKKIYREVVDFLKSDELSLGALITNHKIDIYEAASDLFDYLDPYAKMFGEVSCISKNGNKLEGYAKDPISSGLAMEEFIPPNFWRDHGGEVFIIGAGGSARGIAFYLMQEKHKDNVPSKIIISNRSQPRLDTIKKLFLEYNPRNIELEFHLTPEPRLNDAILKTVKPYSLIINATGLGKDRPGSPLTDNAEFPENSIVWDINYRGDLKFLHQAKEQMDAKKLRLEDGWRYFIHGWTQVIAEVFHIKIPPQKIDILSNIANTIRYS